MSVVYQSDQDWFGKHTAHEEIFDNSGSSNSSWQYLETVKFSSTATWTIVKGFKSNILPLTKLSVEYPIAEESKHALKGVFEKPLSGQVAEAKLDSQWELKAAVSVKPFSMTRASAEIKTCRLNNVLFTTDVQMSGLVKVSGTTSNSKKSSSKSVKHVELTGSIEEALGSSPGFTVIDISPNDNKADAYENLKRLCFRVEGRCSGEVGIGANVRLSEVQSLV
jgi:hypothetical protein